MEIRAELMLEREIQIQIKKIEGHQKLGENNITLITHVRLAKEARLRSLGGKFSFGLGLSISLTL